MHQQTRRHFVLGAAAAAVGACSRATELHADPPKGGEGEGDISPAEDLMREHGVLNRILLIYDEGIRRLGSQGDVPVEVIASSADIIRRFIEQYHEKLEEDFLFPRFEQARDLADLVATLRRQHKAGRELTDTIARLANAASSRDPAQRHRLSDAMQLFSRMYRPHEAREDTVLFPALRRVVTAKELDTLGDQFEQEEHERFGKEGFEGIVDQVASLERTLGIYDLNQFTPPAT